MHEGLYGVVPLLFKRVGAAEAGPQKLQRNASLRGGEGGERGEGGGGVEEWSEKPNKCLNKICSKSLRS